MYLSEHPPAREGPPRPRPMYQLTLIKLDQQARDDVQYIIERMRPLVCDMDLDMAVRCALDCLASYLRDEGGDILPWGDDE